MTHFDAASNGDVEQLRLLLSQNSARINDLDESGNSAIGLASENGHIECVNELINAGADLTLGNWTPLHLASYKGHLAILEALLRGRSPIDQLNDDEATALIVAAEAGHADIVVALIGANADLTLNDRNANSPLTAACDAGHADVVTALIDGKADINAPNCRGDYPIYTAAYACHVDVITVLAAAGANLEVRSNRHTPLSAAAEDGDVDVVKALLAAKADVNVVFGYDQDLLISSAVEGSASLITALLEGGADVNKRTPGGTPLFAAVSNGNIEATRVLIAAGADLFAISSYNSCTYLHNAAEATTICGGLADQDVDELMITLCTAVVNA